MNRTTIINADVMQGLRRVRPQRPVLRYHGGKWLLAPWIIGFFPPHRMYCEPFCGAASVLMRKRRAVAECINDLDERIVQVFRILERRDAAEVINRLDAPGTLFYVDPPYPMHTRTASVGKHGYRHELTNDQHRALAKTLHAVDGMVVLSGYACPLYDGELYRDWERHQKKTLADGARPRTEVVWLNSACSVALRTARQQGSFDLKGGETNGKETQGQRQEQAEALQATETRARGRLSAATEGAPSGALSP